MVAEGVTLLCKGIKIAHLNLYYGSHHCSKPGLGRFDFLDDSNEILFISTSPFLVFQGKSQSSELTLVFSVLTTLHNSSSVKEFLLLHIFIACIDINSFLPSFLTFCSCCLIRLFRRINHTIQKYHVVVLWFKHLRGTRFL